MIRPTATTTDLRIYSVSTGRLLRSWSTNYLHVLAERLTRARRPTTR